MLSHCGAWIRTRTSQFRLGAAFLLLLDPPFAFKIVEWPNVPSHQIPLIPLRSTGKFVQTMRTWQGA
jgi:hypothetical protein